MNFVIKNNSSRDLSQLTPLVQEFYPYAKKHMGFNRDASISFESDLENARNPLGKTAHYNPEDFSVTIYVDGRHPKDIMRSVSHELVHHHQNCDGKLDNIGPTHEGYAQSDTYLREMEEDAYRRGNLVFRDWENQKNIKEYKKMKVTKEELKNFVYEAMKELLAEQSRTGLPDRARSEAGRRLDEEDEEIEEGAKPDFLDVDKDGDKEESMKDAGDSVDEGADSDDWYASTEEKDWKKPEKDEDDENKKDLNSFGAGMAGAQSGVNEEVEDTEEIKEEVEEEETLSEWKNNTLYKKLLKEYTRR